METIRIKGLEIFAYHGVNPEEKENGQKFILDIAMQADISRAAQTDDLNETVNYAAVRKTVNAVFTAQKYDLIERAAQVVCDAILENYPKVQSVTVELKKRTFQVNPRKGQKHKSAALQIRKAVGSEKESISMFLHTA